MQMMANKKDNRRDEDIRYLIQELQDLKERELVRQVEMEELKEKVECLEVDNRDLYDINGRLEKKVKTIEQLRRSKRISAKTASASASASASAATATAKAVGKKAKAVFGGLGGSRKKK